MSLIGKRKYILKRLSVCGARLSLAIFCISMYYQYKSPKNKRTHLARWLLLTQGHCQSATPEQMEWNNENREQGKLLEKSKLGRDVERRFI